MALGLCLGAASTIPASAGAAVPVQVPVVGGLLGLLDGGLLDGLVGGLLSGEGGVFGHEGGVLAGDDELGDVVGGLAGEAGDGPLEIVGGVGDVLAEPKIGGEGSFGGSSVGGGALGLGGILGGLLSTGTGLLGGVF